MARSTGTLQVALLLVALVVRSNCVVSSSPDTSSSTSTVQGSTTVTENGDKFEAEQSKSQSADRRELSLGLSGSCCGSGPRLSSSYGPPPQSGPPLPRPVYGPPPPGQQHQPTIIYAPPPPEPPPPPPPSSAYGPPQFKPSGPPRGHHHKHFFPRPSYSQPPLFRPKPFFGPPKTLRPVYGPPPKNQYGPPPFGLKPPSFFVGPPKSTYSPPSRPQSPKPVYGPPSATYGAPTISISPPPVPNVQYGTPIYNSGGGGAPPTPPVIKYDGWQPMVGISQKPSDSYGPPLEDTPPPPPQQSPTSSYGTPFSNAAGFSFSGNSGPSANGANLLLAELYGVPTGGGLGAALGGSFGTLNTAYGIPNLDLGAPPAPPLTTVPSTDYGTPPSSTVTVVSSTTDGGYGGPPPPFPLPLPSTDYVPPPQGGNTQFSSLPSGNDVGPAGTLLSTPSVEYGAPLPPAGLSSPGGNNLGADIIETDVGPTLSSVGVDLGLSTGIAQKDIQPPSSTVSVTITKSHSIELTSPGKKIVPKEPVKFREPVPPGLLSSIGETVRLKETLGTEVHGVKGPTYLPPPIPDPAATSHNDPSNPPVVYGSPQPAPFQPPPPPVDDSASSNTFLIPPPTVYRPPPSATSYSSITSGDFGFGSSSLTAGYGVPPHQPPNPPSTVYGTPNFGNLVSSSSSQVFGHIGAAGANSFIGSVSTSYGVPNSASHSCTDTGFVPSSSFATSLTSGSSNQGDIIHGSIPPGEYGPPPPTVSTNYGVPSAPSSNYGPPLSQLSESYVHSSGPSAPSTLYGAPSAQVLSVTYGSPDPRGASATDGDNGILPSFQQSSSLDVNAETSGVSATGSDGSGTLSLPEAQALTDFRSSSGSSQDFTVQGTHGSYKLHIQPASGLGESGSGVDVPHAAVLSNGLLRDILNAIEQQQPSSYGADLQQESSARVVVSARPEENSVLPHQSLQKADNVTKFLQNSTDISSKRLVQNRTETNSTVALSKSSALSEIQSAFPFPIEEHGIALFFNRSSKALSAPTNMTSSSTVESTGESLKLPDNGGNYVSFSGTHANYTYGDSSSGKDDHKSSKEISQGQQ